jgi:hypothetical protein
MAVRKKLGGNTIRSARGEMKMRVDPVTIYFNERIDVYEQ